MADKKRIIELVEQGVLTAEEALVLLENQAKRESVHSETREFTSEAEPSETEKTASEPEKVAASTDENSESETSVHSERQEELIDEMRACDQEISQTEKALAKVQTELTALKEQERETRDRHVLLTKELTEKKRTVLAEQKRLQAEIELISTMEQVDTGDAVAELERVLAEKEQALDKLEDKLTEVEAAKHSDANLARQEQIETLKELKKDHQQQLHQLKMKLWTVRARLKSAEFRLPDDFEETAKEKAEEVGEAFQETGDKLSDLLTQFVGNVKDKVEQVDWSSARDSIQQVFSEETYTREWTFEETTATLLDFKNANGRMIFKTHDSPTIHIAGKFKFRGRFDEENMEAALKRRMTVRLSDDQLLFHIPNKRIHADLEITLPRREYDYLTLTLLNGDVQMSELDLKDMYVHLTNGTATFEKITGTMIEFKGTNGDVNLLDTSLRDLLVSTVNGDLRFVGNCQSIHLTTTNGTVRTTLFNDDLRKISLQTVHGTVKLAVPAVVDLIGRVTTGLGTIRSRLSLVTHSALNKQSGKRLTFERLSNRPAIPADLSIKVMSGNVLMKDSVKNRTDKRAEKMSADTDEEISDGSEKSFEEYSSVVDVDLEEETDEQRNSDEE